MYATLKKKLIKHPVVQSIYSSMGKLTSGTALLWFGLKAENEPLPLPLDRRFVGSSCRKRREVD
jgi:hypothetical protein